MIQLWNHLRHVSAAFGLGSAIHPGIFPRVVFAGRSGTTFCRTLAAAAVADVSVAGTAVFDVREGVTAGVKSLRASLVFVNQ
jgi:hypothetical protein